MGTWARGSEAQRAAGATSGRAAWKGFGDQPRSNGRIFWFVQERLGEGQEREEAGMPVSRLICGKPGEKRWWLRRKWKASQAVWKVE